MKDALHELGYMARVYSLVKGVMLGLQGTGRSITAGHKAFQQLLCEVVDEVWSGKTDIVNFTDTSKATISLSTALPELIDYEENSYKESRLLNFPRRDRELMPRSQSWRRDLIGVQRSCEVLDSSFSAVKGAVSFPRQKRLASLELECTPGPGAYNPNHRVIKREPPRFRMPVSGGRAQVTEIRSPGPAYYHPSRRFVTS